MTENINYSNEGLMKLFILHGQCNQIIARTCRKFNKMHPELTPTNKRKFVRFPVILKDFFLNIVHKLLTLVFFFFFFFFCNRISKKNFGFVC